MAARAPIIAGKTVILLTVQDTVDSALNGVKSRLKKFSTSIGNIGLDLFRGGLVGTLPVAGIIREFQTFEDKILFLATKVQATETEFASLTATIRELGRTTSFTSQEVADGATILAQAGFNVREVKESLQALLDLGRGGQLELGQAGAILANTIRSFSLETKDAANVASQFIVAARLGTLDVLDLKESIKEVLGTVRVLNIDLPTTLALLTQLAERSLKGTKAGTSLNTALLQLASKQDVIRKALKIPLPETLGGDSFIVFLQQLYDKLKNLSNLKQVAVLQSLFNIRGGRAITALDDIKKILDLQKAIRGAGNEAREAAIKMDSGFGGSLRRATAAVRDLAISLGGLAAGPLKVFLDTIPPLAKSINQLATTFPGLTLAILATPPAALLAGAGLLSMSFALNKVAGFIGILSVSFQRFGGFFIRGFSAQLTSGLLLINQFSRGIKKIDRGLGARLLGVEDPARVIAAERRVANARKRLRAADISGNLAAIRKAQRNLSLSQGRLTAAKQSSFLGRVGATRIPVIAPLISAMKNFGIAAEKAFRFSGRSLISLTLEFEKLFRITGRNLIFLVSNLKNIKEELFGIERVGQVISSSGSLVSFTSFADGPRTTIVSNFFKKIGSALKLFSVAGIRTLGKTLSAVFRGVGSGLRALTKIDYVRGLYNIFRTIGGIAKGFLIAANAVRRFVFSFSGIFTIAELLLIFGPRIKFIREAFERVGTGISKAFAALTGTFRDASSSFGLFAEGIRSLVRGEGTLGINQLIQSFSMFGTILRSNITIAWRELVIAIAPAYDFLRKFIASTIELGVLFAKLFGTTIGTGFSGLANIISTAFTGEGFTAAIAKGFASLNLKEIFLSLGAAITGTFDVMLNLVRSMFNIVADAMLQIQKAVLLIPGFGPTNNEKTAGIFSGLLTSVLKSAITGAPLDLKLRRPGTGVERTEALIASTNTQFSTGLDSSTKALSAFTAAIEALETSTEAASAAIRQNAAIDKLQAVVNANNALAQARRFGQFDKDLPLVRFGGILEQLPNKIAEGIVKGLTSAFTKPVVAKNDPFTGIANFATATFEAAKKIAEEAQKRVTPKQALERQEGFLKGALQGNIDQRKRITTELTRERGLAFVFRDNSPESKNRKKILSEQLKAEKEKQSDLKKQLALNKLQQRFQRLGLPQAGSIADVVSATVGSIQTARFNKFKALGDNPQKQTNDLLTTISGQLGSEAGNSYLKTLTERAGPLVFQ